jgi:hypothetical protein
LHYSNKLSVIDVVFRHFSLIPTANPGRQSRKLKRA